MQTYKSKPEWHSEAGASLVEWAMLVALIAVVMIVAVSFMSKDNSKSGKREAEKVDQPQVYKVSYRGRTLYCIDMVPDGAGGTFCDFERFYSDYPELGRKAG